MNCTQVREHLSDILDGHAPPELSHHLDSCGECATLISELRKDISLFVAMPVVDVPPVLLDRVMGEVSRVSRTRTAWRFFVPRLAPVAAALALTVLSYNVTPDLWSMQRAGQPPQSESTDVTFQTTVEDKAQVFNVSQFPEDASRSIAVSSLAGGTAFALWSGVVYLWYKKRGA